MHKSERNAIEAVGKRFSATWEHGAASPETRLTVAGKQVALDVRTLERRGPRHTSAARPRLRFDRVVIRLLERLQGTLAGTVPHGTTVMLTITAPIRLPSTTAAALEETIDALLQRRSFGRDDTRTVYGNRVRIRLLRTDWERAPTLIGLVHDSNSDPLPLLNMTRELLELLSAEAGKRAPARRHDRWLVVISARASSCLEAYRCIYSQLRLPTGDRTIVMVFGDGRVGMLTDHTAPDTARPRTGTRSR